MLKFEIGKKYYHRFITDSDLVMEYEVISRTDKTVTFLSLNDNRIIKNVAKIIDNEETARPLGNYSMAPMLRAHREVKGGQPQC